MKLSNQSKLPKQSAPVQRLSNSAAMSSKNGVEASLTSDMWTWLERGNKL